jgi:divalent metal cation (Fe/Co/Zn/Cd) transporter
VVLGLLVIRFVKFPYLDNIIAILLGLYIVYSGYKLVRRSLSGIMDEADEEVIDGVINYLRNERKESWIDIHNLRVIQYGAHLHIDCHVTLPYYLSLEESHAEVQAVEKAVNSRHNREVELFIHADPCVERSCAICQIADCKVRKFAFEKKVEWTLDNLWQNKKHSAETL